MANAQSNTNYCDGGLTCYTCTTGYTYDPRIAGCTSGCPPGATQCSGGNVQNCTLVNSQYQWSTTTTCSSGVCTISGTTASCCVPNTNACNTYTCGSATNNCGQSISCGACTAPNTCSSTSGPGTCGCTPRTKATACGTSNCGTASDGCTGTITCGTCTSPQVCSSSTGPGTCGCTPKTQSQACGTNNCGSASDGCGGTISCGSCTSPNTCSNTSGPGVCQCIPSTKAQACGATQCGNVSDGCTGTIVCGKNGDACTGGTCTVTTTTAFCQTYSMTLTQSSSVSGTFTPFANKIIAGEHFYLRPVLTPTPTYVTFSGAGTVTTSGSNPVIEVTGLSVGQTFTETITAKDGNNNLLAAATITLPVTCESGYSCYCNANCLNATTHATTTSNYCPNSLTCGTCDSTTLFNQTSARCDPPPTYCVDTGPTPNCNTTIAVSGISSSINGCVNTTNIQKHITPYSCVSNVCTASTPQDPITTTNVNLPLNTPCNGGFCSSNGTCIPAVCSSTKPCPNDPCVSYTCDVGQCTPHARTDICTTVNVEGNLSSCIGSTSITVCQGTISQVSCPLPSATDHACTVNNTAGLCKSGCAIACPTYTTMPGCLANPGPDMLATSGACKTGQVCYACRPGAVYDPQAKTCTPSAYNLAVPPSTAVAGQPFTLTPALGDPNPVDNSNHRYTYRITLSDTNYPPTFDSFHLTLGQPGVYTAAVTAYNEKGIIAQALASITITCPDGIQCCPANTAAYSPDGTACTVDSIPGTCTNHVCNPGCIKTKINSKDVTTETGDLCNNGKDDDCNGYTDCNDPSCKTASVCQGITCPSGQLICENACTDTTTSHDNCGTCGNTCAATEECRNSKCTKVQNCQIVCTTDKDCATGMVCINPGDCTKSFCAPAGITKQGNATTTTQDILTTKTYTLTKELRGKELRLHLKNLAPVPLHNLTLTVNLQL